MAPGKSMLEILQPDESRIKPILNSFWGPVVCGGIGFLTICMLNFNSKKPVMSGIQRHLIATIIGGVGGKYLEDYRYDYLAEKDAVLRHYISLHPDDFRMPDREKFADVLQPWAPIR